MANRGPKHKYGYRQRTSVEWSINLLQAIESLRGDESIAVWTEKVLRRDPEIAAQLIVMEDEGFPPPSLQKPSRYEGLMDLLMECYDLSGDYAQHVEKVLKASKQVIMEEVGVPAEDIQESIAGALRKMPRCQGDPSKYARFFYEVIFCEYCEGERAFLQSRMSSIVTACVAIAQTKSR